MALITVLRNGVSFVIILYTLYSIYRSRDMDHHSSAPLNAFALRVARGFQKYLHTPRNTLHLVRKGNSTIIIFTN